MWSFSDLVLQFIQDGLKHSLQLPFQEFEDQRSGETLNILQKVRIDTEKFMQNFINVFFFAVVGITFVIVYALNTYAPKTSFAIIGLFSVPLLF
jgi:ATP-binding cassette subfamily B protein